MNLDIDVHFHPKEPRMRILPSSTVGQLVAERPARSRVFESLGIDYCCGGKRPLDEACRDRGLDVAATIEQLEREGAAQDDAGLDVASMGLADLADHIERVHHDHLRAELPRLQRLAEKVAQAHASRDPRLGRVQAVLTDFSAQMFAHMLKEERVVFPIIRALERAGTSPAAHGGLGDAIARMEAEHDESGGALALLRDLTDGFAVPEGACNSHRALLDGLVDLERDTHRHVHKENNVLFPEALRLERQARSA
jgi:regulator of cell morphogenesis and NO signaling